MYVSVQSVLFRKMLQMYSCFVELCWNIPVIARTQLGSWGQVNAESVGLGLGLGEAVRTHQPIIAWD